MGKILFWVVIFISGLVITRVLARKAVQHGMDAQHTPQQNSPQGDLKNAEKMVRCDHCGLHLPRSEATITGSQVWCSQDHARLGAKQHA
jgi:uncharacterized protein